MIFIHLQSSTMLFDCSEIEPQQSKNILRIPYKLMKICNNFSTITNKLSPVIGRMNAIYEDSSTTKEE